MPAILLHAVTCAAYAVLAIHFWNTRWRDASGAVQASTRVWERIAMLGPIALHAVLIHGAVFGGENLRFGFGPALSVMFWLGALVYWAENLVYPVEGLEPAVLGAAALAVPLPAFFPGLESSGTHSDSIALRIHLALAMAAYSLFVIAVLHAALMAFVERRLRRGRDAAHVLARADTGPLSRLPPLLTLERLLFRMIGLAFALLTLTLATGIAFSEQIFGRAMRFDHKTVFALLSWITTAVLLLGRHYFGWRGRLALRGTLTGFVLLLLAYVGSRFVLEVILGRR